MATVRVTQGHSSDRAESKTQSRARAGSLASEVCPGVRRRPEAREAAGLVLEMGSEPSTLLGTPSLGV